MLELLNTMLKKKRESLVTRLNKKLQEVDQETTPQQLSSLLYFRKPPAVMRKQKSENNAPETVKRKLKSKNSILPEIKAIQLKSIILTK